MLSTLSLVLSSLLCLALSHAWLSLSHGYSTLLCLAPWVCVVRGLIVNCIISKPSVQYAGNFHDVGHTDHDVGLVKYGPRRGSCGPQRGIRPPCRHKNPKFLASGERKCFARTGPTTEYNRTHKTNTQGIRGGIRIHPFDGWIGWIGSIHWMDGSDGSDEIARGAEPIKMARVARVARVAICDLQSSLHSSLQCRATTARYNVRFPRYPEV